jgi:hypothetical protein
VVCAGAWPSALALPLSVTAVLSIVPSAVSSPLLIVTVAPLRALAVVLPWLPLMLPTPMPWPVLAWLSEPSRFRAVCAWSVSGLCSVAALV